MMISKRKNPFGLHVFLNIQRFQGYINPCAAEVFVFIFISFNPFKPEFTIVIFIHYKPRIAVAIFDL